MTPRESAGGGLATGTALIARDRNLQPPLAKQILIYPMLDDRNNVGNIAVAPFTTFTIADNITGWQAVLGARAGEPEAYISPYEVPARSNDLAGLPSTYIDVGELDIFRDEDIAFATRLFSHNVPTELHVYPGLPHAFEAIAPQIPATQHAMSNRRRAMQSF